MRDPLEDVLATYQWDDQQGTSILESSWLWYLQSDVIRKSGIKLHISSGLDQAPLAARILSDFCREEGVAYKISPNLSFLESLNMGFFGQTQVGKFATIYPVSDLSVVSLVKDLKIELRSIRGPTPPSDFGVEGSECISYRVGEFSQPTILGGRRPAAPVPEGYLDPLRDMRKTHAGQSLATHGYRILKALAYRGRGGTFLGIRLANAAGRGQLVILKEAKKWGERDSNGMDSQQRLLRECQTEQLLEDVIGVRTLERLYLGVSLIVVKNFFEGFQDLTKHELFSELSIENVRLAFSNLLQRLHAFDLVLNDISPGNVLMNDEGEIRIIDFEQASPVGVRPSAVTAPFSPNQDRNPAQLWHDWDALDKLIQWMKLSKSERHQVLTVRDVLNTKVKAVNGG